MKRAILITVISLAAAMPATTATAVPDPMTQAIVVLRDQVDPGGIQEPGRHRRRAALERALRARADAGQRDLLGLLRARRSQGLVSAVRSLWIFNGIAVTATPSVLSELAARPEVREIRPDLKIQAPALLASTGPAEPNVALLGAPALWDLGHRGQGVVVATLDTGVDATHPDLAGRYRGGANSWYDPNGEHPSTPIDVSGHGTATMGVMVGGDAGGTAIGIAPDAKWIAAKIFNDRGTATAGGIHLAIQWLMDPDGNPDTADAPDVVNNSWTGSAGGCALDFQLDLRNLRAAGILPVFAAGNSGPTAGSVYAPANNAEAFAVGATDNAGVLDPSSGRGPSPCAGAAAPRLTAPGVNITTTDLYGLYTVASGTSLSAPHAAGALALLLSAYPDLDADRQAAALQNSAVDLGAPGFDNDHGYGRLDALAAYQWLASAPDFTLAVTPSSRTARVGGSAAYTATVGAMNGFTGAVALSVAGLPAGATASWTLPSIPGSGGSQLTVSTPAGVAPGGYPLTISGSSGGLSHSTQVTLVVSVGDFALSASPATLSVVRGGSASSTVSVSVAGGFSGSVSLSASGLPSGSTAGFAATPVAAPGTSRLTVRTTSSTARGTFTVIVAGVSGPLVHRATVTLTVR
ncbi:S8 family serine peptidase [Sphaerisporangium perillae]|uniref:S8 family serine peptidase n=1 Tax=Sphaerisporangium perillae TaxID=2935860 RepID=UPI00201029A1|nr:S8 family serine peptidase [Sphaerisporangium perillae]